MLLPAFRRRVNSVDKANRKGVVAFGSFVDVDEVEAKAGFDDGEEEKGFLLEEEDGSSDGGGADADGCKMMESRIERRRSWIRKRRSFHA